MARLSRGATFSMFADNGSMTKLADGTYLAVWSTTSPADGGAIYGQVFNADGSKKGGQLTIVSDATASFSDVSVAALKGIDAGKSIVTWMQGGQIKKLVLDASFTGGTVETVDWAGLISEKTPKVYALDDGGYSIVYQGTREMTDSPNQAWYGYHTVTTTVDDGLLSPDDVHHASTILTNNEQVLIYANAAGDLQVETALGFTIIDRVATDANVHHAVTALAGGKFVVTWQDVNAGTAVINAQFFDASHSKSGSVLTFAKPAGTILDTKISQLSDGTLALLVTTDSYGDKNVYAATYTADGQPLVGLTSVGANTSGDQMDASIVPLAGGSFAVAWEYASPYEGSKFFTEVFNPVPLWTGTGGADTHAGTQNDDDMDGLAGNDYLMGLGGNDSIIGGDGSDTLDGGDGMDTLVGGNGDDVFYMTPGDAIIETAGGGRDTIIVGYSASLGNDTQVEILKAAAGTAPLTLGGANMNDTIIGNSGANRISGGTGNDVLTGGKGKDTFVFDTRPVKKLNVDVIKDFNAKDDTIALSRTIFTKVGKVGTLKKNAFWIGDKAHDADDRIIVTKKGKVLYDVDGTGKKAAVEIATLEKVKVSTITYKDFLIFA
ncbi:calcium-binding protein [Microvirga flavescens]|uniref:calcium-binding protein n=1 Tax=Microvirga flavescens TaxID=2249811 RepID=UPI0013003285|nr:calcium-binding protein [Microvirga flavescens]